MRAGKAYIDYGPSNPRSVLFGCTVEVPGVDLFTGCLCGSPLLHSLFHTTAFPTPTVTYIRSFVLDSVLSCLNRSLYTHG